jgi:hypothetical protein
MFRHCGIPVASPFVLCLDLGEGCKMNKRCIGSDEEGTGSDEEGTESDAEGTRSDAEDAGSDEEGDRE